MGKDWEMALAKRGVTCVLGTPGGFGKRGGGKLGLGSFFQPQHLWQGSSSHWALGILSSLVTPALGVEHFPNGMQFLCLNIPVLLS
jgi:hypothetical protein